MFSFKKKKPKIEYSLLLIVILVVILVILGFALLRNMLFPLLISAIWAIILKLIKNAVKGMFFSSE